MNSEWFICVYLTITIFPIVVLLGRFLISDWLHPGTFFTLFWFSAIVLFEVFFFGYKFFYGGILWVAIACISVFAGSLIGTGTIKNSLIRDFKIQTNIFSIFFEKFKKYMFISIAISFIGIISLILSADVEFNLSNPIESLIKISARYSFLRYSDENYKEPSVAVFCSIFSFLSALLGGIIFGIEKSKRNRIIAFFSLFPSFLYASLLTTRASIIFSLILWISSFLSIVVLKKKTFKIFKIKVISLLVCVGVFLILIYICLQGFRRGLLPTEIDRDTFLFIWDVMRQAYFGSVLYFSLWFENNWYETINPSFGSFTFGRVLQQIGLQTAKTHPPEIYYGLPDSTVFTLFRDTIEDFTLPGSLIFFFLFGILGGFSYTKVKRGKIIYIPLLILFYSATISSLSCFMFRYTTISVALLIFYLLLCFERRKVLR